MTRRAMAIVVVFLSAVSAYAHHSQAAQYDTSKEVKIQGTLVQFQFRNPHTFIQVEAPDDSGNSRHGPCHERRRSFPDPADTRPLRDRFSG